MLYESARYFSINLALTGLICQFIYAADLVRLSPVQKFQVSQTTQTNGDIKVREMRAGGKGLWFLAEASAPSPGHVLIASSLAGNQRVVASFSPDTRPIGLAGTSRGVATVKVTKTERVLTEFSDTGQILSASRVGCVLSDGLLTVDGRPATICPNGTITRYSDAAVQRYSSWAKPGSAALMMGNGNLAIVDRETGGILYNNLKTGEVSAVRPGFPEIAEALNRIETAKAGAAARRDGDAPLGNLLVVMDAAADSSGLYLLIYPYRAATGAVVVRLDNNGAPVARFQCLVDGESSIHKLAVQDGFLLLASIRGRVFRYKL